MPKDENEFQKLLSEAPAAPDADTITVVGILARTADAGRFVLRLPNGRAETLEVSAVKSSRKVAGAIGQPLVELVLDAKQVPESLRGVLSAWGSDPAVSGVGTHAHKDIFEGAAAPFVAATARQVEPSSIAGLGFSAGTRTYLTAYEWTSDHHILHSFQAAETPFVAAAPHQVAAERRAELSYATATRTYLSAYTWTGDHHTIMKAHLDGPL